MIFGRTSKMLTTGFCMLEAEETRDYPRKVKLSLEKPGYTFWLPNVPRYKQVGLFTFKKVKAGEGKRRATSRLSILDMKSLLKAQWSSYEARVRVSVTWHRSDKCVIFVRLHDFLSQLLTADPATQIFILQVNKGKVVMWHCKSVSEEEECDHVNKELKADDEENEHVTTKLQNKRQKKRKPCRAKADVGLMFGVMHVHGQDPDAPTEGWAVACTKKKRPQKQKALPPVSEEKALQAAPAAPKKATSAPRRNTRRTVLESRGRIRCWTPRWPWRLTSGAASVQQEFAEVRVTVPPPLDAVTDTVRVRGAPQHVAGTVARLKALLHEGEMIAAQLAVTPRQWRDVVDPAGATLRTLLKEYLDVGVTVSPAPWHSRVPAAR